MARLARLSPKQTISSMVAARMKQFLILLLTVMIGVLVSVSVNAQKTSEKKKSPLPFKVKNRSKANHYASSESNISITPISLGTLQSEIIREMVAQNLRENTSNAPVKLAPLIFTVRENKLAAIDIYPLLIAVEFGLQGKTILIESSGVNPEPFELSASDVHQIRAMMENMGVPSERVAVATGNFLPPAQEVALTSNAKTRVDFIVI